MDTGVCPSPQAELWRSSAPSAGSTKYIDWKPWKWCQIIRQHQFEEGRPWKGVLLSMLDFDLISLFTSSSWTYALRKNVWDGSILELYGICLINSFSLKIICQKWHVLLEKNILNNFWSKKSNSKLLYNPFTEMWFFALESIFISLIWSNLGFLCFEVGSNAFSHVQRKTRGFSVYELCQDFKSQNPNLQLFSRRLSYSHEK